MAVFLCSQSFCQKICWEEIAEEILFIFCFHAWSVSRTLALSLLSHYCQKITENISVSFFYVFTADGGGQCHIMNAVRCPRLILNWFSWNCTNASGLFWPYFLCKSEKLVDFIYFNIIYMHDSHVVTFSILMSSISHGCKH